MLKSRSGGMHHSLLSPGTGDFTHFHLGGGVRGFQKTGTLQAKQ